MKGKSTIHNERMSSHFSRDRSYLAERNKQKAHQVTDYLKSIHGITVPENFPNQLSTAHLEGCKSSFCIHLATIDSVVNTCKLFEDYVLDINELVCWAVLSMVRIHTCVISKSTLEKDIITVKENFPMNFRAIIQKNGNVITSPHIHEIQKKPSE